MRATVLVVDGRGFPDPLVQLLERHGCFCLYARGPLKVRAHLAEHKIDLVVWKDNAGNPALSQDLFQVWADFPALPIIQLFTRGSRPATSLPAQVRDALPAEVAQQDLVAAMARVLAREQIGAEANELAFRNVLTNLRGRASAPESDDSVPPDFMPTTATALNRAERERLGVVASELSTHVPRGTRPGAPRSPWRWLRALLGAARLGSSARV